MAFFQPKLDLSLGGKTLIVPVVSTGNVAQLAVDHLIASLSLEFVGDFDSQYLVPAVGAREDNGDGITTPLELYGKKGLDIVVIQQRSPTLKSRKQEFVDSIYEFIKESKFAAVLFLTGVDLTNRSDAQMLTPTYHIVPPTSPSIVESPLRLLSSLPIPPYTTPAPQHPYDHPSQEPPIPFIPGGGLTRRILSSLPTPCPVPTVALLQFVAEGDNRGDAELMARVLSKLLDLRVGEGSGEWRAPSSWRLGLFGTPHDQTLYG